MVSVGEIRNIHNLKITTAWSLKTFNRQLMTPPCLSKISRIPREGVSLIQNITLHDNLFFIVTTNALNSLTNTHFSSFYHYLFTSDSSIREVHLAHQVIAGYWLFMCKWTINSLRVEQPEEQRRFMFRSIILSQITPNAFEYYQITIEVSTNGPGIISYRNHCSAT